MLINTYFGRTTLQKLIFLKVIGDVKICEQSLLLKKIKKAKTHDFSNGKEAFAVKVKPIKNMY